MSSCILWRQGNGDSSMSANIPNGDVVTATPHPKRVIVMSPHPDDDGKWTWPLHLLANLIPDLSAVYDKMFPAYSQHCPVLPCSDFHGRNACSAVPTRP